MAICRNWRSPYRRPISKVWGLRPIRPCRPPLSLRPGPSIKKLKVKGRSWTKTLKQVPGRNLIKPSMEKWNWAPEFKMKSNKEELFSFSRQKLKKVFWSRRPPNFWNCHRWCRSRHCRHRQRRRCHRRRRQDNAIRSDGRTDSHRVQFQKLLRIKNGTFGDFRIWQLSSLVYQLS